jgi:low temperature requirement protein LtrA
MFMFDLFTPPRFFQNVTFHRHTQRSIGWLELFYDLVYVATLIQIGNFLSDNLTLVGFAQFIVMLTVVWWAWTGETFYQNRYVVDDIKHRFLVFTQIFAVATLGLSVSGAFGELYVQFTLAYVVTRFILVLMWVRAYRVVDGENNQLGRTYIIGFSVGILVWLGSLLLPAEIHWVGWLAGIAVELTLPLLPALQRLQRQASIDLHHLSERFGIFTIIVLGESFVKILDDSQGTLFGTDQFLFNIGGFLVLYSLWWLYFSDAGDQVVDFAFQWKSFAWLYGHLPLSAGLVAFGVGAKKLYASTLTYADKPLNPEYRLLYTVAIVMFLVALALIDYGIDDNTTFNNQLTEMFVHLFSAVIVAIIGLTAVYATPAGFVAMIAIVMVAQVAFSIYLSQKEARAIEQHKVHTEHVSD